MGRVVVIVFLLKTTIDRFQEDFRLYYQAHYWKKAGIAAGAGGYLLKSEAVNLFKFVMSAISELISKNGARKIEQRGSKSENTWITLESLGLQKAWRKSRMENFGWENEGTRACDWLEGSGLRYDFYLLVVLWRSNHLHDQCWPLQISRNFHLVLHIF